jgi:tRNA pseudouridine65 synthase
MSSRPLVQAPDAPPAILYRDEAVLVVDKPSGLAVHRGYSSDDGDYLMTRVRDEVGHFVYLAHRLDRGTSGAVLFTTRPELIQPLQQAFQSGAVDKRYLAIARGRLEGDQLVDYAIPRSDARDAPRVDARTWFRAHGSAEGRFTLVEARPLTGRYHQIRRHLKHLHHPIAGDTTYGDGSFNRAVRERFGLMRLALHAARLTVPHPVTGQSLTVEAPLPDDMRAALRSLGLPEAACFAHLGADDDHGVPRDSA